MSGGFVAIGEPVPRIDGRAKVTGQARYAAEIAAEGLVHGVVVNAAIARGRIVAVHDEQARAVRGVLDVLWHGHRSEAPQLAHYFGTGEDFSTVPVKPLVSDRVHYAGQPVALVLAESWEAARHAAGLVRIEYDAQAHATDLPRHHAQGRAPKELDEDTAPPKPRGDADETFAVSPVKIDAEFHQAAEHHNPMELHASTVVFEAGGALTVHDKNQGGHGTRRRLAKVFGLPESQLTLLNTFVGGAFGSGLRPQYNLLLAIVGALHLRRAVRVVLTRQQMFTFGHRPEIWQRVRLGAERDGTLNALIHEAVGETSRVDDYTEMVTRWSRTLYRSKSLRGDYRVLPLDLPTPLDMRAPGAASGLFPLEVAMDELAQALGMDPLALRLANYAERAPSGDKPYSSKKLRECYTMAAERFGWSRRNPQPRSMREGHELVGWGMASGQWIAEQEEAQVRVVWHADGHVDVETAASDIGTGTATVLAQVAASALGVRMEDVRVHIADTRLPQAPTEGGSSHVASVGSAVDAACEKLCKKAWQLARAMAASPLADSKFAEVEFVGGQLRRRSPEGGGLPVQEVLAASGADRLEAHFHLQPDEDEQGRYERAVHSAVFCEVRVDDAMGTVRVTRVVSAVACGRIINELTARSQVLGGIVWGIGQALHEGTLIDQALGRFMTVDLANYHVPVNADIHALEVIFVPEDDRIVSRLGAKGVGEIGGLGVAAAISNAISHATGRRIRTLPMTPDKVMAPVMA
ncbi:xanthine dehydrogenase family protein molybdopterin-binding subunit [Ramlibacter ginsenosidimutans]|uniref:Xanthine dehydrogenase family protein molybdopterin-binding subunit n=1 Tax=Ramlibacter ginsenosidimutans TaxID=502333 RepID=A0A934WN39_9BURK|nr:xanthine dehydrogenase family protein molybdopterin-binding subunit [Ramlibacter ginsenosidimutans]MBK6007143.1 xanthine dehydrogenase family protein molybdopterin-binding subunit [Ramlibacter ginsenosidimutans]